MTTTVGMPVNSTCVDALFCLNTPFRVSLTTSVYVAFRVGQTLRLPLVPTISPFSRTRSSAHPSPPSTDQLTVLNSPKAILEADAVIPMATTFKLGDGSRSHTT